VHGLCDATDGCVDDHPRLVGVGAFVGRTGGTLVGASVGSLVLRWERRFP
jgi:hypothetical protein